MYVRRKHVKNRIDFGQVLVGFTQVKEIVLKKAYGVQRSDGRVGRRDVVVDNEEQRFLGIDLYVFLDEKIKLAN